LSIVPSQIVSLTYCAVLQTQGCKNIDILGRTKEITENDDLAPSGSWNVWLISMHSVTYLRVDVVAGRAITRYNSKLVNLESIKNTRSRTCTPIHGLVVKRERSITS
jgi:hypothetical protein